MKIKSFVLGLAAAVTVAAPIGAVAAERASVRAVAPSEDGSELASGGTIVLALLGAAAVIGGIVALSGSNDDDLPVSG